MGVRLNGPKADGKTTFDKEIAAGGITIQGDGKKLGELMS